MYCGSRISQGRFWAARRGWWCKGLPAWWQAAEEAHSGGVLGGVDLADAGKRERAGAG